MLGRVPLMLGHGTGAEIRQPLTLFITPVIYLYLDQLSDWVPRWRLATPEDKLPATSERALRRSFCLARSLSSFRSFRSRLAGGYDPTINQLTRKVKEL
jgi:hypothetical protein